MDHSVHTASPDPLALMPWMDDVHPALAKPAADDPNQVLPRAEGRAIGTGLGVLVTEGLAALPSWNAPVLDSNGKPVESVPGAQRVGDHDILTRHEEVVGPKIAALVDKLPPGRLHELVRGLGEGATEAPGDSYRLEAGLSDLWHGSKK